MGHFLHDGGEKLGIVFFEVVGYFVEDLLIGEVVELQLGKNFLDLFYRILFILSVKTFIQLQGQLQAERPHLLFAFAIFLRLLVRFLLPFRILLLGLDFDDVVLVGLRNEGDPLALDHVVLPEADEILGLFAEESVFVIFDEGEGQFAKGAYLFGVFFLIGFEFFVEFGFGLLYFFEPDIGAIFGAECGDGALVAFFVQIEVIFFMPFVGGFGRKDRFL